ncbi:MAG: hypothetical protein ACEQSX_12895 [Baekduiaceae bacterium]
MDRVTRAALFFLCALIVVVVGCTSVALGAELPPPDDATGWLKWSLDGVENGILKVAAGGAVMLLVWGVRALVHENADPTSPIARFAANRWGALSIAVFTSIGTGIGHAWAANNALTFADIRAGVEVFFASIAAWELGGKKLADVAPVKPAGVGLE